MSPLKDAIHPRPKGRGILAWSRKTEGPFDRLTVLSKVEGLTTPSKVDGLPYPFFASDSIPQNGMLFF
jgi:hypothetical protein